MLRDGHVLLVTAPVRQLHVFIEMVTFCSHRTCETATRVYRDGHVLLVTAPVRQLHVFIEMVTFC